MNAIDDDNYTSTSCKPFATTSTTTSIHDNNDVDQSILATSQYEETAALQQLKQKLESVPADSKSSLLHAQKVTDIINDDHLLGFLYAENFNVDVSLQVNLIQLFCVLKIQFPFCLTHCCSSFSPACFEKTHTLLETSSPGIW